MIKYICKDCNNLICETSTCPVCNKRTYIYKMEIYWCVHCNIPIFNKECSICNSEGKYIGSDIRPVFSQERLLLETILGEPFKYKNCSVWNSSGNNYIVDGKKINFSVQDTIKTCDVEKIRNELKKHEKENLRYNNSDILKKFVIANQLRLNYITNEAITYIKEKSKNYKDDEMFISFSGGKDSTITSDIVMKALGKEDIIHIYGDTTLEYPTTAVYMKKFRETHPRTPVLVAKNKEQDFNELCRVIGPPSRMMRWCCTIFKTGAITRKITSTFKDKKRILTFQGIRRNESTARSKYDRESNDSKISKQLVISPIIDWLGFDTWLYIIGNNIDFNDAYRQGFSRVGCWCCPNNSGWSEFLSEIYMQEKYEKFHKILIEFAKSVGKPDPEEYIREGGWKARQGGNGLNYSKNAVVEFKPCALYENAISFDLNKKIDMELYEFFKPFGTLNFTIGNKILNEVYVLDKKTNEPLLKIVGRIGQTNLKVIVVKFFGQFKDMKTAEMLIKNQITKYQVCIGCLACESNCKFNAIKITDIGNIETAVSYNIDENKCVGCLECVKHFSGGCFMRKVLRTKKGV